MQTMKSFFFTYGTDEKYPFYGGWTRVNAPDRHTACGLFKLVHPCRDNVHLLNCASVYDEEQFHKTEMYESGNFDRRCHEVISMLVYPGEEHWDGKEDK